MLDQQQLIARNLARIHERMAAAAMRAGRRPDDVRLVAVTKYVGPEAARAVVAAGCADLGESRPQELWRKADALGDLPIRWHLIGHLQRNKVRQTLPLVALLHAGDSQRLLEEIDRERPPTAPPLPVLIEVNISGDAAKHGFAPDEIEPLLPRFAGLPRIRVTGLMAMSGLESDEAQTRREFSAVRDLRERLARRAPPGVELTELSMGMSGDFELAIAEGATIVRVGSALFEGLSP